jgi:hypothetical protein
MRCLVGDLQASSIVQHACVLVTAIASRADADYDVHTRSYRLWVIKTWQMSHRSGVGVHGWKCVPLESLKSVPALEGDYAAHLESAEERIPLIKYLSVVHRLPNGATQHARMHASHAFACDASDKQVRALHTREEAHTCSFQGVQSLKCSSLHDLAFALCRYGTV